MDTRACTAFAAAVGMTESLAVRSLAMRLVSSFLIVASASELPAVYKAFQSKVANNSKKWI